MVFTGRRVFTALTDRSRPKGSAGSGGRTSADASAAPPIGRRSGPAAALRQDPAGLGELGGGDVEEGGTRNQSQQRQRHLQLVQQGDGDDGVGVQQPVAEQNHQTLLLGHQSFEGLRGRSRRNR